MRSVPHEMLSVRETADTLHLSTRTVRELIHSGELKAITLKKGFRVSLASIEAFQAAHEYKGQDTETE